LKGGKGDSREEGMWYSDVKMFYCETPKDASCYWATANVTGIDRKRDREREKKIRELGGADYEGLCRSL
jgi:hypothetical protein